MAFDLTFIFDLGLNFRIGYVKDGFFVQELHRQKDACMHACMHPGVT